MGIIKASTCLLLLISYSGARPDGATNSSCYNHLIHHTLFTGTAFETPLPSAPCNGSDRCREVTLIPSCPPMQDAKCCMDFDSNILYTNCSYLFEWNTASNLGYLIQARVDPQQSQIFNNMSEIVGTWTNITANKILNCRSSLSADENAELFPNSITHNEVFTENNNERPSTLNMTWTARPSRSQQMQDNINITFFYTIARDVSTNFYPYTKPNLSYELRPFPLPPTEAETSPSNPATNPEGKPVTTNSSAAGLASLSCISLVITGVIVLLLRL